MLWKKFSYTKYEEFQKKQEYARAQEYCASFPQDKNAVICELYSRSKSNAPLSELDTEIRIIGWSVGSKEYRGYDRNVLYLLGELLFERGFETEGDRVLRYVASLEKMREKISGAEKKARLYLERFYFQKWENSHELTDLKQAADCFGHSSVCYLYAELLREKGGDRNQEEAIPYETVNAMCYCVIWMNRITYYQTRGKERQAQILDDIRKDIGVIASDIALVKAGVGRIESHIETMTQMIHDLPEETRNALYQDFNDFRAQMDELSRQVKDRDENLRSLVEQVQALDLDLQSNQNALQEIKALAEQISAADQDREDHLARSIDGLKKAMLENDNLLLQEIVDEAAKEIDSRFHGRLSKVAKDSIITALFTLNFYKELNKTNEALVEYSGVVILATSALEIELYERLYKPFGQYVQKTHGQTLQGLLHKEFKYLFTLGSFGFVVGILPEAEENISERDRLYEMFCEFVQNNDGRFSTDLGSLFQRGSDDKLLRKPLKDFDKRLYELNKIRRDAAHIKPIDLEKAKKACRLSFLSSKERAIQSANESISLLEWLLKSCIQ